MALITTTITTTYKLKAVDNSMFAKYFEFKRTCSSLN